MFYVPHSFEYESDRDFSCESILEQTRVAFIPYSVCEMNLRRQGQEPAEPLHANSAIISVFIYDFNRALLLISYPAEN